MSTRSVPFLDRLVIARIASGIGGIALVVAILGFLLQRDITTLVLVSTVIGIIGIALWLVLAPGDLKNLVSGRQALYGSNSIFAVVLVIGIVAVVYTLTTTSGIFADLTSVGYYTLKPQSRAAVQALTTPIQITAFYNSSRLNDQALDTPILRMFSDAAPDKVKLVFVDPDTQPLIGKQFGLLGSFGIYVSVLDEGGQPDMLRTTQMRGEVAQEQWITQAILQLQAQGKYHVLFTVGHGELGTDIDKKEDAYGIRAGLENFGISTGTIDLKNQSISPSITAIVILSPQADFDQTETDKIAQYTASGGKLLIMAKPAYHGEIQFMTNESSPMYKYLWQTWGIRPHNDIVFDPTSNVENPYRVLAAFVAPHEITNKDDTGSTQVRPLLTIAESWLIPEKAQRPNGVNLIPLILSSQESVGKIDLVKVARNPNNPDNLKRETGDLQGPLVLAAAAENEITKARLIVVGDSDWITNELVTRFDGSILWTNMIDWLTQYLSNIEVNATITQPPLIVDSATLNIVILITLVILPGVVLVTGGIVWWNRLRRQ